MTQDRAPRAQPGAFEQAWRDRFERYGAAHDDDAGIAGWSESGLATRFRRFRSLFEKTPSLKPGQTWLDAGCGAGTYSRFLVGGGAQVLAVDYSLPTLLKARARSTGPIAWATADVTALPIPSASVDGALCFGVLQALSGPGPALDELARVVRPGGYVWVDALNAQCVVSLVAETRRRFRRLPPHLRYDRPRELAARMRASRYEDVRCYWVPIAPGRLRFLQPLLEHSAVQWLIQHTPFVGSLLSHSVLLAGRVRGGGTPT